MEYQTITYKEIKENPEVTALMERGNDMLGALGYTEHSKKHACKVAKGAGDILSSLGYDKRICELARIAGYMHDIGNCVNRTDHAHSGALLAFQILRGLGMPPEEVACVVSAIGQHDEKTGTAVDPVSAALILADKSDVRRNRVRYPVLRVNDIHDRVNGAVDDADFYLSREEKTITLSLRIDTEQCAVLEYFEIFLNRMLLCQKAAKALGCAFKLLINGALMMG